MLLLGLPMRNTEYNSRLTPPLRAPTIRSVPETVLAKLLLASLRRISTPSKSATESVIDATASPTLNLRLRKLLMASAAIPMGRLS